MAKKYVIIAPSIIDMGGAQMYIRNKCVAMQEDGWIVNIFSANKGIVFIQELKQFDNVIPELNFDYFLFPKKKRIKIVDEITNCILDANYDNIVIESTCISECTWAEVIAKRCNASHFCFLLQENNLLISQTEQDFFLFKQSRSELVGICDCSIYDMFKHFAPIKKEQSAHLKAYCNNVVEDLEYRDYVPKDLSKYDFKIGLLSRIDKPFITPALTDFIEYASNKKDKSFLLIMIGGAPNKSNFEKNILNLFSAIKNVDVLITGYLFPIPQKLLEICDAHISSAGSAWVCSNSGVPTISYDGNDFKPIGILNRTTNHSLFRDKRVNIVTLAELLDDILISKKYQKVGMSYDCLKPDFSSHYKYINKLLSHDYLYFSFENINLSVEEARLSLMLKLLGARFYTKLSILKRKFLNKTTSDI
jgi:hypothetical protein